MPDKRVLNHDLENVYNLNEDAVIAAIEKYFAEEEQACRCGVCIEDVFALSLNKMPAKYIQNYFGARDPERLVDTVQIERTVRDALAQVAKHPHHD